ncbi:hypothetical protein WJX84_011612 [Apatococcus fuscideae]|uniref:Uncharacterized protein n=1 Tax=Apatococcus fuscideae TaxID=2026836 RepID=A0AAW1SM99_9CHLO
MQGKGTPETLAKLVGNFSGKDAFGSLHAAIAKALTKDMVYNMQGSFVVQKAVMLSSQTELVVLARVIMPWGSELMSDKSGPHLLMKIVDNLVLAHTIHWSRSQSLQAGKGESEATPAALYFLQHQTDSVLGYADAGRPLSIVLVEAVQGALPRSNAITVAKILATEVIRLVEKSGGGLTTLLDLISLQPSEEKAAEEMTTAICIVASHCEGKFAQIALRTSTEGHQLVRRCLERLSAAEERDWVDTILAELVSDAEALNADRKALDVLIFALSLATINHLTFTNHLQTLDILVDGPQADLIREEAIALRAESGLIPGQQGVEVASAAAQTAAHQPPPPPPLQQRPPSPPTPKQTPPARDEGLILPGSSAFAAVGTMGVSKASSGAQDGVESRATISASSVAASPAGPNPLGSGTAAPSAQAKAPDAAGERAAPPGFGQGTQAPAQQVPAANPASSNPFLSSMFFPMPSSTPTGGEDASKDFATPSDSMSKASSQPPSPGHAQALQQAEPPASQARGRSEAGRRASTTSTSIGASASGQTTPASASSLSASPARPPSAQRQAKAAAPAARLPPPPPARPARDAQPSGCWDAVADMPPATDFSFRSSSPEPAMLREARAAAERADAAQKQKDEEAWMVAGKNSGGWAAAQNPVRNQLPPPRSEIPGSNWARQPPPPASPPVRPRGPSAGPAVRSGVASVQQGAQSARAWTCHICTYLHEKPNETNFLTCKICGSEKS